MKLFIDNLPYGELEMPKTRPGEFFPRLVGIRVSGAGNWLDIEPLYIPALRVSRRAGQVLIEINSSRPLVYITLQARRPFINVFRFPWEEVDIEQP